MAEASAPPIFPIGTTLINLTGSLLLGQQGRYRTSLTNGIGMFVMALLFAGLGLWLGSLPW